MSKRSDNFIAKVIVPFLLSNIFLKCIAYKRLVQPQYGKGVPFTKSPKATPRDSAWIDTISQRSKVSVDYFTDGKSMMLSGVSYPVVIKYIKRRLFSTRHPSNFVRISFGYSNDCSCRRSIDCDE